MSVVEPTSLSRSIPRATTRKKTAWKPSFFLLVGIAGFEPTTFRPPDERATRLRYIPKQISLYAKKNKKARFFFISFLKNHSREH